jgi:hypothetical protein
LRRQLDSRKQRNGESALAFYYAILELCDEIEPQMSIDGIAHYFRLGLSPRLVEGFHYLCSKAQTREELEDSVKAMDNLNVDAHGHQSEVVQLINALSGAGAQVQSQIPNTRTWDARPRCFRCNQPGHFARGCAVPQQNYFNQSDDQRNPRQQWQNRGSSRRFYDYRSGRLSDNQDDASGRQSGGGGRGGRGSHQGYNYGPQRGGYARYESLYQNNDLRDQRQGPSRENNSERHVTFSDNQTPNRDGRRN